MTPLDIFEKIAKDIPRCSHNTGQMRDFIVNWAKNVEYTVHMDNVGNILCQKNTPRICLQAHYDMVCVGDVNPIRPYIKDGWMYAKSSSLGADNGIGVAMMLSLMEQFDDIEFLFTADEEVGLVGAKNIELKISSTRVLNLDSEEEGAIYVACAGGVDISSRKTFETAEVSGEFFEVSLDAMPGGHSGVDIDKNIPNAIVELAKILLDKNIRIASFEGGEKRNSIPSKAKAIICVNKNTNLDGLNIRKSDAAAVLVNSNDFLCSLTQAPNGVVAYNTELGVVETSSNIGIVSLSNGDAKISISARSMSKNGLQEIAQIVTAHFFDFGYKTDTKDSYEPWEWEADEFSIFVKNVFKKYFINANFKAIHAGLECAALKKHFPDASFASVGPTIEFPHSLNERVELSSIEKTFEAIFETVRQA